MVSKTAWQPVHAWLAMHRAQIMIVFRAGYLTATIAIITAFFLLLSDMQWWLTLEPLSRKAGTISALLYITTLIPGLLKRFGIFPLVRASMMLFRRQLGVTMFLMAGFHQSVMTTFPMLIGSGTIDWSLFTKHELYGAIAFWSLFPLWLTSNETSVKKLGPWWHWVHRLTYMALFFIYLHVATLVGEGEELRIALFIVMVLEAASWLYFWVQNLKRRAVNIPPTSTL